MTFLGMLVLLHCEREDKTATVNDNSEEESIAVEIVRIKERGIRETIRITGEIIPLYQIEIYSKVAGLVVSEGVEMGQRVHKGMVLARVKQDVPGMEYTAVDVEATQDGVVTTDRVETGDKISPQQPLYTIQGLRQVYFRGSILESDLRKAETDRRVNLTLDAFPGRTFSGTVAEIGPVVDPVSRMGKIKILLDNPDFSIKPGMFGQAVLETGHHKGLVLPVDAIVTTGARHHVFVVQEGYARRIRVYTATISGKLVEVTGDLKAGDPVVVLGQNLLEEHTPVRIVREFRYENL